ncbi:MAG TPA: serine protease [Solirubrobacteraceae bacterium]|nr:serine protease [Solirubrobacteraceae bacterium]
MREIPPLLRPLAAAAAVVGGALAVAAPADAAAIRSGVQTVSDAGQCTSNFVFYDGAGDVFIGQAAHCTSTGSSTDTNGCQADSLPLGSPVDVEGASRPGTLAYNSWLTMHAVGEQDADTCEYNDLALVRLDPADAAKVNPTVKFWGGPSGIDRDGTQAGDVVFSYGNSSLRLGIESLSPKRGISLGTDSGGWNHSVYTLTPGIPGDSGSAFLDADGRALGVLSTLAIAPLAGSNGVGDVGHELDYLNAHGGLGTVTLADGTEPFDGSLR